MKSFKIGFMFVVFFILFLGSNHHALSEEMQYGIKVFLMAGNENPIKRINRNVAYEDLKRHLLQRYPGSYSTVEMLLKAGMADYDRLCSIPDNPIDIGILEGLNNKYYPSFSTIYLLYKSNRKSYDNLSK